MYAFQVFPAEVTWSASVVIVFGYTHPGPGTRPSRSA